MLHRHSTYANTHDYFVRAAHNERKDEQGGNDPLYLRLFGSFWPDIPTTNINPWDKFLARHPLVLTAAYGASFGWTSLVRTAPFEHTGHPWDYGTKCHLFPTHSFGGQSPLEKGGVLAHY